LKYSSYPDGLKGASDRVEGGGGGSGRSVRRWPQRGARGRGPGPFSGPGAPRQADLAEPGRSALCASASHGHVCRSPGSGGAGRRQLGVAVAARRKMITRVAVRGLSSGDMTQGAGGNGLGGGDERVGESDGGRAGVGEISSDAGKTGNGRFQLPHPGGRRAPPRNWFLVTFSRRNVLRGKRRRTCGGRAPQDARRDPLGLVPHGPTRS